ncbi:MAG TPA: PH domain-containing protein, partial [Phnomibacter sp.]|nr:PH domain-containing protein [Phnomibacter sp.]
MKVYPARRDTGVKVLLILLALLPLLVFLLEPATFTVKPYLLLPLGVPFAIFAWAYFTTKYWVEGSNFYYKSAFLRGTIPMETIREIHMDTSLWAGTKPALATKGMIIKYKRYRQVYIAPVSNE